MITSENQIQRLNHLIEQVKEWQRLDLLTLTQKLNDKSWSVVEVIEHMSIAYDSYIAKVDQALAKCPTGSKEPAAFKSRTWQKIVINAQRPKGNQRKWKMKTLSRFEPQLGNASFDRKKVDEIFANFYRKYGHLHQSIIKSRQKEVTKAKFPSAIGSLVSFYLPECFEFVLSHAERHQVQIQEILAALSKLNLREKD